MDQHVQLTIEMDSKQRVSFNTKYGWVDSASISLDMTQLSAAKKVASQIVEDLQFVPAFNCSSNEEFVKEAWSTKDTLKDAIENIDLSEGKRVVQCTYPFNIRIKFEETYKVHFGEES